MRWSATITSWGVWSSRSYSRNKTSNGECKLIKSSSNKRSGGSKSRDRSWRTIYHARLNSDEIKSDSKCKATKRPCIEHQGDPPGILWIARRRLGTLWSKWLSLSRCTRSRPLKMQGWSSSLRCWKSRKKWHCWLRPRRRDTRRWKGWRWRRKLSSTGEHLRSKLNLTKKWGR